MRIATYNVEWFASLFDDDNRLYDDDAWAERHGVTRAQQTAALGQVFNALDADAVMVIEAPNHGRRQSTVAALEHFAARFSLRTRAAVMGFPTTPSKRSRCSMTPTSSAPAMYLRVPPMPRALTRRCGSTLTWMRRKTRWSFLNRPWSWR